MRSAQRLERARQVGARADRLLEIARLRCAGVAQEIAELEGSEHAAALAREGFEEDGGAGDDRGGARGAAELAGVVAIVAGARLEIAVVEGGDLAAPALDVNARAVVREVEALAIAEAGARRRAGADHDGAGVAMAAVEGAAVDRV